MVRSIDVELPADKSLTHRAILLAAMAEGQSTIVNPSMAYDCQSTRSAVEAFGVHVDQGVINGQVVYRLRSKGATFWQSPEHVIDAGNSGTTARFLLGVGCAISGLHFELKGDDSLMNRPMARVVHPLRGLGATIHGRENGEYLPMRVEGKKLAGFEVSSAVVSAQVKSALLLAASMTEGESRIHVPRGTRDHTERMMKALGARLTSSESGNTQTFVLQGPWNVEPFRAVVPKDPSAMAFFAVLAFLQPGLKVICRGVLCNEGRLQFLRHLEAAGLDIVKSPTHGSGFPGETLADFEFCRTKEATSIHVTPEDAPGVIDEIPALAVAAAVCSQQSLFQGLSELRVKESDRLSEVHQLLFQAGIQTRLDEDAIQISPSGTVKGFRYQSFDHRMVMAAAVLATVADSLSSVGPREAARISFPLFFERLQQIYG